MVAEEKANSNIKKKLSNETLFLNKTLSSEPDPAYARRVRIIFKNLNLSGKEKVLDIGCGRGFYLRMLSSLWPNLKLYGIDRNNRYLNISKKIIKEKSTKLIRADANNLPFQNNFFDRIIASEVLEHIKTDQKVIEEIYRVLKPGGLVIITVPNKSYPFFWDPLNWILERILHTHIRSDIWWLAGIWADHERLYSKEGLNAKLKKEGFEIEKIWLSTRYCFPFSHHLFYGIGMILIERGFFTSFNRFTNQGKQSMINRLLLYPIRAMDKLNRKKTNSNISVNIVIKVNKS